MDFIAASQSGAELPTQLKILVVDDDVLSQRMMRVLLTREGHQVDTVSNGPEALEAVKLQKYDIIFMDLQMPMMDGIQASRSIREWENGTQHTFIVALTASYLPEKGQTLFEAGIDNYISKPFELEHIQRLLKYSVKARLNSRLESSVDCGQKLPSDVVLDIQRGVDHVRRCNTYRELLSDFAAGLQKDRDSTILCKDGLIRTFQGITIFMESQPVWELCNCLNAPVSLINKVVRVILNRLIHCFRKSNLLLVNY
jgi:CheY-like chemotaxis protein